MKKQKILLTIILIFAMLFVFLVPMISFASNTITFETETNTNLFNIGETVNATIGWDRSDVQAVEFSLQYDNSKLEFVDATFGEMGAQGATTEKTLEEDFYNAETPGTIYLSKISLNDLNIGNITFNFKTISKGAANIKLINVSCVANGNLVSPDTIDYTTNSLATIQIELFGDVDLNGTVNNEDATMLNQYIKKSKQLNEQQLKNADVNLDEVVDETDYDLLQKAISSSITLPIRYGDVNLDGATDMRDIVLLNQFLTKGSEISQQVKMNADVNLDGLVNEFDVNVLHASLSDWMNLPFKAIKNKDLKATDSENLHIVTGFNLENMKVRDLLGSFNETMGIEICNSKDEKLGDDATVSTGAKIKIIDSTRHPLNTVQWLVEYNVVIYGDTTGDGKINAIDALALIKHLNGAIPFTNEVFTEAGRIVCEKGEKPTAVDALAIIKHANKKVLISQTK